MSQKFDFVIIGAGAAGCVLAKRIVDTNKFSVLLIEAGPKDYHPFLHFPSGYTLLNPLDFNWRYSTIPQKNFNKRKIWFPQGKVLGGSSSINGQVFTRGNKNDYDNWSKHGCTGWSYREILPYFKKSENNNRIKDEYHGTKGPLKISDNVPHILTKAFVESAQQEGLKFNHDFNGETQEGCGYHQVTNSNGTRSSASNCYLKTITGKKNFKLITSSEVLKIEIKNNKANSITFKQENSIKNIEVSKELILTAGAIGSPKLLLLSGIGSKKELNSLGIDSVLDLPSVGKNLHDHTQVYCMSECSGNYSFDKYKKWHMKAKAGIEYLFYGTGIISSNICEGGAFLKVNSDEQFPDVQLNFVAGTSSEFELNMEKVNNGVVINALATRPRSRGYVRLRSSNPSENPLINPNYWDEKYDIETSVKAVKFARNILTQKAFKSFIKREVMPGNKCKTDEDIIEYARKYSTRGYHPVGTCKMGDYQDKSTVVTSNLRLKDTENVRICDSSIMPFITSSNTYAATIMIAEKAADIICEDYIK